MKLDDLLEQEYAPKAADAAAKRDKEATAAAQRERAARRAPIEAPDQLNAAVGELAKHIGARHKRKSR